jgi:hypothetical protein
LAGETKTCGHCQRELPIECFPFRCGNKKKIRRHLCRSCKVKDDVRRAKAKRDADPERAAGLAERNVRRATAAGRYREHARKAWSIRADKRRANRTAVIEMMGGRCEVCGFYGDACCYDLHHIDPSTKSFKFALMRFSHLAPNLMAEVAKCALLCCVCHREHHAGSVKVIRRCNDGSLEVTGEPSMLAYTLASMSEGSTDPSNSANLHVMACS